MRVGFGGIFVSDFSVQKCGIGQCSTGVFLAQIDLQCNLFCVSGILLFDIEFVCSLSNGSGIVIKHRRAKS